MNLEAEAFTRSRVLVAGDVMLDRYWSGQTSRVSPEAPVPVVRVDQLSDRPGGAANVALNVASLGVPCDLLGVAGNDEAGRQLRKSVEATGVSCKILFQENSATITKLRVLSRHQQLIRLDFEDARPQYHEAHLKDAFDRCLSETDVVVLSDYNKGTLTSAVELIERANRQQSRVLVDPKGADFRRYTGAYLLTPNRQEFETVVGACENDTELERKARVLIRNLKLQALLVTRSEQGMTLVERDGPAHHFSANVREVFDVTGAGDTVIAVLAAALAAGHKLVEATELANIAAGLVVAKLGAASVTVAELQQALSRKQLAHHGVLTEEELLVHVERARQQGERLVMTNGCFDILHRGHVAYLREARALGDRLIVAVNTDASVQDLKGTSRPINPLVERMAVLAALEGVDWVVPFSESTPARLIARVLPDVLVKGGDYRAEEIAGYDSVTANGGEVKILPYLDGISTTAMIARIRALE